jgi:hypothetical protein
MSCPWLSGFTLFRLSFRVRRGGCPYPATLHAFLFFSVLSVSSVLIPFFCMPARARRGLTQLCLGEGNSMGEICVN